MSERLADMPHRMDDGPEAPEKCPLCLRPLTYEQQCADEPLCDDCRAVQAQEENE